MADLTPRSKAFFPSIEHQNCRRREGPNGMLKTIPKAPAYNPLPPTVGPREQNPSKAHKLFVKFALDESECAEKRKAVNQKIGSQHIKMFHHEQEAKWQGLGQPDVIHLGAAPADVFKPSLSPMRQHLPPMSDSTLKRIHVGPPPSTNAEIQSNKKHSRSLLCNAMASSPGVVQRMTTIENSSEEAAKCHRKKHAAVGVAPEPKHVGLAHHHGVAAAAPEPKHVGVKHLGGAGEELTKSMKPAKMEVPKHIGVKHLVGAGEELTNSMKPAKMEVLPQHRGLVGRKDPHPPTVQDHLQYREDAWQPMAGCTHHHHMLRGANKPAARGPHMLDPNPFRRNY